MRVTLVIKGLTPLVMHNGRLADPLDPVAQAIADVATKKDMTLEDLRRLADLQWRGALYYEPEIGPYIPAANIVRCLRDAATEFKLGTAVFKGLIALDEQYPLVYDGSRDINVLASREEYTWRTTVVLGQRRRVPRSFPTFRSWGLTAEFELLPDVLGLRDLNRIAERAGQLVGLCDGRRLGKGRFGVEVRNGSL